MGKSFLAQTSTTPAFSGKDIVVPVMVDVNETCSQCGVTFVAHKFGGTEFIEYDLYDGRHCCSKQCYDILVTTDKQWVSKAEHDNVLANLEHRLHRAGVPKSMLRCDFDNLTTHFPGNKFRTGEITTLFISGQVSGSGKTHLAIALLKESIRQRLVSTMMFTTVRGIQEKLSIVIRSQESVFKLERYLKSLDFLIIDDMGSEKTTDATTALLYELINHRLLENKKTIITSNLTNDEIIRTYGQRIFSRISSGYVFILNGTDHRGVML